MRCLSRLALALVLLAGCGCDSDIPEPRLTQLVDEATGAWINGTGLQVRRAEAVKAGGSSLEIVYVLLEVPADQADVVAAIERSVTAFNKGKPNPLRFAARATPDFAQGVRKWDRQREPPSWWPATPVAGTTISIDPGPKVYIPDASGPNAGRSVSTWCTPPRSTGLTSRRRPAGEMALRLL